jgi:hypothetical protein
MVKLLENPIQEADVNEYINNHSDFSFELTVLNKLCLLGFECEHAGQYEDPVSGKYREFDIQACRNYKNYEARLSVECKAIREHCPLVVHCTKRTNRESFHELLLCHGPVDSKISPLPRRSSKQLRFAGPNSIYHEDEFVGKSVSQVARRANDKEMVDAGEETFEKIRQSLHASKSLIEESHYSRPSENRYAFICPILVIPEDMLWIQQYSSTADKLGGPRKADYISYSVSQSWRVGNISDVNPMFTDVVWYTMSHLEIVCIHYLETFLKERFNDQNDWRGVIPSEDIIMDTILTKAGRA